MNAPLLMQLASWSDIQRNLTEGLGLMFVGMAVVFVALVVIGQAIRWTTWLLREKEPAAEAAAEVAAPIEQAAPGEGGITPELIAVLTAAATAVVGKSVQVHRVRHLAPQDIQGWVYSARAGAHRLPAYRKGRQ